MAADGIPVLEPFATASVQVDAPASMGETGRGVRRFVPIIGGTVEGDGWRGTVQPGGIDYQWITDGKRADLEARYVFDLDNGFQIYVVNRGFRVGSQDALRRVMQGEPVSPGEIYSYGIPTFETNWPALQWISDRLFIAGGRRLPDRVEIRYFQLK